jgi:cobalt-zinc-cadmium efflux system outer membrane protein
MIRIVAAAAISAALPWASPAQADSYHLVGAGCAGPLDSTAVVRCALANSPAVAEARHHLAAVDGRRTAAGVWLPSNPTLAGTLAHRRRRPEDVTALNWSVTLAQEFEVGGQRGIRIAGAQAEAEAAARRVTVAEQEVAAAALAAFFEAAAATQALEFADELVAGSEALARVSEARVAERQLSGIEADVARAEAVRFGMARAEAGRRRDDSRSQLALLLGLETAADLRPASLAPPDLRDRAALERQALHLRGEVAAAEMERRVLEQRLALHKRERIPNLTVSAFAERGEIDDRILGVGLSIPLPLPAPVGRTRAGEIAETLAEVRAAESSLQLQRRRVRLELARALASYTAREQARALVTDDLRSRARADLRAVRDAVAGGQLALREAVLWQRSLTELLAADIETRLQRELAVLELRRVVGLPLPGGAP